MEGEWPELWRDLPMAVVDVETTGLDASTDRIIEIGIVRFERGEEVEVYGELIDPGCPIPPEVTTTRAGSTPMARRWAWASAETDWPCDMPRVRSPAVSGAA